MKNTIKNWNSLNPKYNEKDYIYKKVIDFFDFFNYNKDFLNVYEPAEDSYLLIDTLFAEKDFLNNKNIQKTVEVGCGSGLVSLSFIEILSSSNKFDLPDHFCVDINRDCIKLAERLFDEFKLKSNFIESDLFEKFEGQTFDVILFNPVIIYFLKY